MKITDTPERFLRLFVILPLIGVVAPALAGPEIGAGLWWVYGYSLESDFSSPAFSDELDSETGGSFSDPALVLYANDDGSDAPWHFSGEVRFGPGSFTDPLNNSSGDSTAVHQAWIGYDFSKRLTLTVGKSQVPFGWKTANFWPGDLLTGGYGDQMDVGAKVSGDYAPLTFDLAYYHQDDWGETSTDTLDDGGHWGSASTYRKIKTGVINTDFRLTERQQIGFSGQYGRLQDLVPLQDQDGATQGVQRSVGDSNDAGTHRALDLHYRFDGEHFRAWYRYIHAKRDFSGMDAFLNASTSGPGPVVGHEPPVDDEVETQRHAVHLGYKRERWHYVLEATTATSDTEGNTADRVQAWTPGVRYQYGPGWLYLEYLWQNGDIDRNGDVSEADFRSLYVAFDFYF